MHLLERLISWWCRWNKQRCFCRDYYVCRGCGYAFPKKEATIAGWHDHPYGYHVHCPECDRVVDQQLHVKEDDLGYYVYDYDGYLGMFAAC